MHFQICDCAGSALPGMVRNLALFLTDWQYFLKRHRASGDCFINGIKVLEVLLCEAADVVFDLASENCNIITKHVDTESVTIR